MFGFLNDIVLKTGKSKHNKLADRLPKHSPLFLEILEKGKTVLKYC